MFGQPLLPETATKPMNAQLRDLLTRIPASPETDELQDLLTLMENERLRRNTTMRDALAEAEAGLEFALVLAEKAGVATPQSTIPLALNATRAGLAASLG
jgi:hypothetical protein